MLTACEAIDGVANTRIQRVLRQLDEATWMRHHRMADILRLSMDQDRINAKALTTSDVPEETRRTVTNTVGMLRFGNMATMAAITRGQAEKLHLDLHDNRALMTTLMVLGREGDDWNHAGGKGDLHLPMLGLAVPLYPGDVVFFQPAVTPHLVKLLQQSDLCKRVVITLFSCEKTTKFLEEAMTELEALGLNRD